MAQIHVERVEPGRFRVIVSESNSETEHLVSAQQETTVDIVEASFRFLLDREPKESILREFDLAVISRYFPDYEARLDDYLG